MKNYKLLLFLIIAFGILCFSIDRQLFYYGKNNFNIYSLLPLNIIPESKSEFDGGFALEDKYGFTIAARGNTYDIKNRKIIVNKVLKYGFKNQQLLAIIVDSSKEPYFLIFDYLKNDHSKIHATMYLPDQYLSRDFDRWIDIEGNDTYVQRLIASRDITILVLIILLLRFFYILVFITFTKKEKSIN